MTAGMVWITGASAGIGAALARTVPFPATVIDVSRSGGPVGIHLAADLADPSSWDRVIADFRARLSGSTSSLAVLISNAGTLAPIGFAHNVDPSAYRRNVLLNAAAPQVLGQAFLHALHATGFSGRAHVVTLTSGAAENPYPGWSSYGAAKAAINQWTRTAGAEDPDATLARVIAVAPGTVETAMQATIRSSDPGAFPAVERFTRLHEDGANADPDNVARRLWALLDRPLANGAVVDLRRID